MNTSRKRVQRDRAVISRRHCEERLRRSNPSVRLLRLDCFASTGARSRDRWLAMTRLSKNREMKSCTVRSPPSIRRSLFAKADGGEGSGVGGFACSSDAESAHTEAAAPAFL